MEHGTPRVPFMLEFDYVEDESDEDRRGQDSSEDELDIILHGTPKQKRKLTRSLSRGSLELSSSEDEFEKDMEKELNETMRLHEEQYSTTIDEASSSSNQTGTSASGSTSQGTKQNGKQDTSLADQFYHDVYFDSDDSDSGDEGEGKKQSKDKKQKLKHRVLTDEELLYDPNIDDENQQWVDRQRQKYRNQQQQQKTPSTSPAGTNTTAGDTSASTGQSISPSAAPVKPKSDAVLNCPACITTLCLDCQQHDLYHNQFRAMFVLNCSIVRSERLKYPVPKKNKRWNRNRGKKRRDDVGEGSPNMVKAEEGDTDELYFPVKCSVCNTEVGVYDEDEVFHFFNVLASTA